MDKVKIKPLDVIDNTDLPVLDLDHLPGEGDPLEINHELYYVCEKRSGPDDKIQELSVIPLVVKNPAKVTNIKGYISCLSAAHRKVRFFKDGQCCDLQDSDEMVIS